MQFQRFFTIALAVATAAVALGPAAATHGTWLAATGALEPSTSFDDARHMFQTSNAAARERVYFNGFVAHSDGVAVPRYDLNVDGGSLVSPGGTYFMAVLGFWRDCNGDGYIGAKVVPANWGNFASYPRQLVDQGVLSVDTAVCPLGSAYNPTESPWIDEFRNIGPGAGWDAYEQAAFQKRCGTPSGPNQVLCIVERTDDRYDVTDNGSKVWADWGFPGGMHVPHQGLVPQPRGTYSDSDNTLYYVDFALQGAISTTVGPAWGAKPNVGGCDAEREFLGGPGGTCGLWPMYQVKRLLNDSDSSVGEGAQPTPFVQVFDTETDDDGDGNPCDDFTNTTLPNGRVVGVPDVAPALHPNFLVEGSVGGTYKNLFVGGNGLTNTNTAFNGQCANGAPSFTSIEGEGADDAPTHSEPDDVLTFAPDQRIHGLKAYGFDDTPIDGLGVRGASGVGGTPVWYGGIGWTPRPPRTGWGSISPTWATFHADVTSQGLANAGASATVAFPAGGADAHRYGSDWCAAFSTGPSTVNELNWDCSIPEWERVRLLNEDPKQPILGDPYDLRDVDCMDNTIAGVAEGVRLGVAACEDATH